MENLNNLRKRPASVRYFYLAAGAENLHVGLSYGGLLKAHNKDSINTLFISDIVTKRVQLVNLEKFMDWWRIHYQDPTASYVEE